MPQELWCKKMPPTAQLFSVYKMQHLEPPAAAPPAPAAAASAATVAALTETADALGKLLQYRHACAQIPRLADLRPSHDRQRPLNGICPSPAGIRASWPTRGSSALQGWPPSSLPRQCGTW